MFRKINRLTVAPVAAEFLGTATLVLVAIVLAETTAVSYFIATSLAVTLAVIVLVFGRISGAHVNPAVTFGMWTARRIGTLRAVSYVAAQMLGGLAAWQLYQYLVDKPLEATKTIPYNGHLLVAEIAGTFVLALGYSAAVSRAVDALQSALVYGSALFVGIIAASVNSIGMLNPAISLGLRSWGTAYALGPLIGAFLGVNIYFWLFAPVAASEVATSSRSTRSANVKVVSEPEETKKPVSRNKRTTSRRKK